MRSDRTLVPALLAGVAAAGILGCTQNSDVAPALVQSPAATVSQLSGEEIKSRLAGRTFHWLRARDQAAGQTQFAADGAMSWKRSDVTSSGTGKWWVKEDKLCQQYAPTPQWKGGLVCRTLSVSGGSLVTSPNDGGLVTFTEVAG